jgi:ABC-type lipoprotein release transport system permease subunit
MRSSVLLLSIVLGIWAGLFIISFSFGLNTQRVAETINSTISHVQIHQPQFEEDQRMDAFIPDAPALMRALEANPEVVSYSPRIVLNCLVNSTAGVRGLRVLAVDPEQEAQVSSLPSKLTEGAWLPSDVRNPIFIGEKLAVLLNAKPGSKLVLTFQDAEKNVVSGAFRVAGIYKSYNTKLDEVLAYVRKADIEALLGTTLVHEVALMTNSPSEAAKVADELRGQFPDLSIKMWKEISPELGYVDELMAFALSLVMLIIMLALMFGIINNMLMAVLERKHELGMLQAVGMNKMRIFTMIVIETLFIGLLGGPLGMLLGYITISITGRTGIDLSMFGQGLESFGIATRIYPNLAGYLYVIVGSMVVGIALLASIFPARKALKLNPVEAIRSI